MPLSGIDAFAPSADLRIGDSIVTLFTYREGARVQQWLGEVQAIELTADERAHWKTAHQTVYTSTGLKFAFDSRPAALRLRMWGPCDAATPATARLPLKETRVVVQSDFLRLGLYSPVAKAVALREAKIDMPYNIAGVPFPAERTAKGRIDAENAGLTPDDERGYAAIIPALDQFLGIAQHTPGLSELAYKVMDLPPIWAWVTAGKTGFYWDGPRLQPAAGAAWGLPGTTVYRAPMTYFLKNTPALNVVFVLAPAQPPLVTCAGIVELTATSPKHPEKSVDVRVLSARAAH